MICPHVHIRHSADWGDEITSIYLLDAKNTSDFIICHIYCFIRVGLSWRLEHAMLLIPMTNISLFTVVVWCK